MASLPEEPDRGVVAAVHIADHDVDSDLPEDVQCRVRARCCRHQCASIGQQDFENGTRASLSSTTSTNTPAREAKAGGTPVSESDYTRRRRTAVIESRGQAIGSADVSWHNWSVSLTTSRSIARNPRGIATLEAANGFLPEFLADFAPRAPRSRPGRELSLCPRRRPRQHGHSRPAHAADSAGPRPPAERGALRRGRGAA